MLNEPADDLAALLAEHNTLMPGHLIDRETKTLSYQCVCKQVVSHPTTMSRPVSLAAHQAEVIAAAGWVKGRKEWGVVYEGEREPDETSDDRDWLIDECITGVYGEGETPPKLARRYVTDWEEVPNET